MQHNGNDLLRLEKKSSCGEKSIIQELEDKEQELSRVRKELEKLEKKSKADIKALVKEVKSLRSSEANLKQLVERYSEEKTGLQVPPTFPKKKKKEKRKKKNFY